MICTFCVMFMHMLTAQEQQIRGRITDQQGNPLEQVIIRLTDRQTFDETDPDGRFVLQARAGDRADILHVNFKTQSVILEEGIAVVMEESVIALDNILVKADPFRDVPQSTVIQDRVKSASQPRNVSDLFKDIPGFGILKRGNYASEPVFRSFKYEQLNVQYDGGMKILNACPNRMDPITTHVIPEEIERIEIVKGPFTVRFGQNFGGIINMVSRSTAIAEPGWSGNLETGYETNGGNFSSRASLVRKWERVDVEANASYRDYGDYTDGAGDKVPSSFRTTDYSIKFGLEPTAGQRIRLTWRQSFARDVRHAGLPMDSPYDDSYLLGLDYRYLDLGEKLPSLMVKAYYSHVDHLMSNEERPNHMMTGAESNVFVSTFGGKAELEIRPSKGLLLFAGMDASLVGRHTDHQDDERYASACAGGKSG